MKSKEHVGETPLEIQIYDTETEHYLENYILFLVKPICCIFLHISMQPKVKEGLDRMMHIMMHPEDYD